MFQYDTGGIYHPPGNEVNKLFVLWFVYVLFVPKGHPVTMDPVLATFLQELISSSLQIVSTLFNCNWIADVMYCLCVCVTMRYTFCSTQSIFSLIFALIFAEIRNDVVSLTFNVAAFNLSLPVFNMRDLHNCQCILFSLNTSKLFSLYVKLNFSVLYHTAENFGGTKLLQKAS